MTACADPTASRHRAARRSVGASRSRTSHLSKSKWTLAASHSAMPGAIGLHTEATQS
jgi:hypothetical protein